jgi:hypothetical protein
MITKEQILELAKSYKFDEFVGEKDDETDGVYWECWEDQLIKFAEAIYQEGYDTGYDEGWESSAESEYMNSGLEGELQ